MNLRIFNASLLIGWLLVLAGGVIVNVGWGLAIGGGVLLLLALLSAYIAGIYEPKAKPGPESA